MKLRDVPNGCIFKTKGGIFAVKTEYHYTERNGEPMCILLSSGEYAHFPEGKNEEIEFIINNEALDDVPKENVFQKAFVMIAKHQTDQFDTLICLFGAYVSVWISENVNDDYNLQQRMLADIQGFMKTARDERVRITQQLAALDLPFQL